jgi:hypothetical protein
MSLADHEVGTNFCSNRAKEEPVMLVEASMVEERY